MLVAMLDERGFAGRRELDGAARAARVLMPLSAAEADYVSALTQGRWKRRSSLVLVPTRMLARLRSASAEAIFDPDLLRSAIAWERAAVLSGLTMTEWGISAGFESRYPTSDRSIPALAPPSSPSSNRL